MIFARKSSSPKRAREDTKVPSVSDLEKKPWFMDLQRLSNEELIRIYSTITNDYEFAKNAWYIPMGDDKRCPIMIAKGHKTPYTLEEMAEFEDVARILEEQYRRFIDAWDFGYITRTDIKGAILALFELRTIKIVEII
ncbi:MAG: hypothetical protein M3297_15645 [Thermoproteota archaeon]|nr:hypothetical protein [Thermoproteota archaeon]